jgi:hypothetical protein
MKIRAHSDSHIVDWQVRRRRTNSFVGAKM